MRAQSVVESVRAWRERHEVEIVRELDSLLAIPNNAADRPNIRRNAELLRTMLQRRGVTARILENGAAPPAVLGELKAPGATRTVILYAHYDGQPVDPKEWATPPFEPVLRARPGANNALSAVLPMPERGRFDPESRIYARSASDDKAPIVAMLAALDAMKASGIAPSVNLKFFYEGEEEAGSDHLKELLTRYKDALGGDVWLIVDGPVHQSRKQLISFGVRGTVGLELTTYGPARALHSGHYGNWAPNPGMLMVELLASLRDGDGNILIDHYMDDVVPPTAAELAAVRALPPIDAQLRHDLLLAKSEGNDAQIGERLMKPAVNLRGIRVGNVAPVAANAIAPEARASIDFRLVPNQTPVHVKELLEAHLAKRGWWVTHDSVTAEMRLAHARIVRLQWEEGYPATRTSMELPVSLALRQVISDAKGEPVLVSPTSGASLGQYIFTDVLHAPTISVPIVNHDNDQHAKNENLRLQNLWDGIETLAAVMANLGKVWPGTIP
ncbi:MAG: M20/M25/M40 family metallo-hydrolase [Gemmatimonadetes bacterium]|nr:M20/M25/M40 family metallo-hydrolase [Gemmatimonadota bacterium]